ncbi:MAG: ribonuclease P protein component [Promicromonosporaceae bacterium]|nr:ribonuclease P protein component [Promicromonosporaceae bacterium]
MLPSPARLRDSSDFAETVRLGARAGRSTLVVHALASREPGATRVGFVVSKAVGNAVTRNRVKRRLRELARPLTAGSCVNGHGADGPSAGGPRADDQGAGATCRIVVRALPAAAEATFDELQRDLEAAAPRAITKALVRSGGGTR